ncbi:hypothetical protein ACF0H5_012686 [Mactra antiquata]
MKEMSDCLRRFKASFLGAMLLCVVFMFFMIYETNRNFSSKVFLPKFLHDKIYLKKSTDSPTANTRGSPYTTTSPMEEFTDSPVYNTLSIFSLSTIGLIQSNSITRSDIKITGWVTELHRETSIKCCTLLYNGDLFTHYSPDRMNERVIRGISGTQISCPVNSSMNNVKGIAIQFSDQDCPQNGQLYVKPYVLKPPEKKDSFGICLKLLYGQNINIVNLKTWIEYYIELGVDKVFMYTYDISKTTKDVLNYYGKKGFLERRPFDIPFNQTFIVGRKTSIYFQMERVIVYDCYQRFTGYKYFAVVDLDEFIVPRKHNNIKQMMEYLMNAHPKAAGYTLKPYLFIKEKSLALNSTEDVSDIAQYVYRSPVVTGPHTRQKNILIHGRIKLKSLTTHAYKPDLNYERYVVSTTVASLNHYRHKCYGNLRTICSMKLTKDTFIFKFLNRFHNRLTNTSMDSNTN